MNEIYCCYYIAIVLYTLCTESHLLPKSTATAVAQQSEQVELHSCQPLSGVNLSPELVNLYFPYAGWVFCFFAGGSGILNSNQHMWQSKEDAMLCEIHVCDLKSNF